MKKYLFPALKLTLLFIVLCAIIYPLMIAGVGRLTPGEGGGEKVKLHDKVVGYALIGQQFTDDKYFWGRPSAVDYNASGSAGSNKGPSNPDYLALVQQRIDSFLLHNPRVDKSQIPAEMVTASGSGLDPHISPASAFIQVSRVARARKLSEAAVKELVEKEIERGWLGPDHVNVLKLNIALDELNK